MQQQSYGVRGASCSARGAAGAMQMRDQEQGSARAEWASAKGTGACGSTIGGVLVRVGRRVEVWLRPLRVLLAHHSLRPITARGHLTNAITVFDLPRDARRNQRQPSTTTRASSYLFSAQGRGASGRRRAIGVTHAGVLRTTRCHGTRVATLRGREAGGAPSVEHGHAGGAGQDLRAAWKPVVCSHTHCEARIGVRSVWLRWFSILLIAVGLLEDDVFPHYVRLTISILRV